MLKRAWFVASVIAAFAALVVGSLMLLDSSVTRPTGALVIVVGLMPVALLLAGTPDRRRMVGGSHIAAGALFAIAGLVLASQNNFLWLRLATIDWRILATSGHSLAPVGWVATGVALMLTGLGLLRSQRSCAVLSALLMIFTCGYFAGSLAVAPYLLLRHRCQPEGACQNRVGVSLIDQQAVIVAIVLLLVALLLIIAALSRYPVRWMPLIPHRSGNPPRLAGDSARPDEIVENQVRRWMKPAVWSAVSLATVAGVSIWAWLTWGPRFVLADVFPDPNLASCVAHEMGQPGSSTKVSHSALTRVRSLSCNGDRVETAATYAPPSTHPLDDLDKTRIQSIQGLDTLTNLAGLSLPNNKVSDLTPLADLQKLGSITLTNNQVTDLTPLAGHPVLTNLGLSGNTIADLTPLTRVRTLRFLGLTRNHISDLAPLAGLTGLSTLDVSENLVSDITPLAHLPQLSRLTLAGNTIVSPAPLRNLPALSMLNISRNRVADAATFVGFTALEELWVGGNLLTDVTPLAALPALTGVDLEGAEPSELIGLDVLRARNIYVGGFA